MAKSEILGDGDPFKYITEGIIFIETPRNSIMACLKENAILIACAAIVSGGLVGFAILRGDPGLPRTTAVKPTPTVSGHISLQWERMKRPQLDVDNILADYGVDPEDLSFPDLDQDLGFRSRDIQKFQ